MPGRARRGRRKRRKAAIGDTTRTAFVLDEARRVASRRFRIERLTSEQERALAAVADARDVLVVQPTGSGKSLDYQLASILLQAPTVVISPLLALLADQEAKLRRIGAKVFRIDSTVGVRERREALAVIAKSGAAIILTTPETLAAADLQSALARSGVALAAIDEAHCISEWGHDFRPAYLRIAQSLEPLRPRSVIALTATATPRVREEIIAALRLHDPELVLAPPHRANLAFSVDHAEGSLKLERLGRLIRRLRRPGIVYCATVARVERIAAALRAARVPSAGYHGRMRRAEKEEAQRRYMSPRGRLVMVATSAFGMGVDKPNVRYVVHEQVPGSLEQYVQEAGRAGRDGRRALCVLLFDPSDLKIQARLHAEGRPRPEAIGRLCDALRVWAANGKPVEPKTLALSAQVTGAAAKAVLVMLNELGAVAVEGSRYRLVVSSEELDSIAHDLARRFETLRREDRHRLEAVEAYARTNECRSVFLRRYFGEQEPPTCGMCDRCVARAEAARVVHVLPG